MSEPTITYPLAWGEALERVVAAAKAVHVAQKLPTRIEDFSPMSDTLDALGRALKELERLS